MQSAQSVSAMTERTFRAEQFWKQVAKRKVSGWLIAPGISQSQDFLFQTIHTFQCRVRSHLRL